MVFENWENLIVPSDFGATFMNFYNEFLAWFISLDLAGQIITGLLIILGLVFLGYLIYGILWIIYQIGKAAVVGSILLIILAIILIKIVILTIVDDSQVNKQWNNSIKDLKWFIGIAYPSTIKHSNDEIKKETDTSIQKQVIMEPPKVFHLKEQNLTNQMHFHCPNCGARFTDRMNMVINTKKMTYCEACGQQFIAPIGIFA